MSPRGLVVPGSLDLADIATLASTAQNCGYHSVWLTVVGDEQAPATLLRVALEATTTIEVGLGVIPLDRFRGEDVARSVLAVPADRARAVVGFGVGRAYAGAADRVREHVSAFAGHAPGIRTAVGSYGSAVLAAAGALGCSLVLNWMTPQRVAWAVREAGLGSSAASAPGGPAAVYVYLAAALGADAPERIGATLRDFGQRYPYHRRHQAAMSAGGTVGIAAKTPTEVESALAGYYAAAACVVPVINPVGDLSIDQRLALVDYFKPSS
jgi:hypothetical protein